MRTSNIVQKNQSSQQVGENAIAMSIDEESTVFLMDALGKLYSRPAQAALREYLSNAIDAHKAKGGKLPAIQITLPDAGRSSSSNQRLLIRDFGKGMTEQEFEKILSRYGASTKRDSNAMIGGFGLGAKSGFAVSNEFFMTSYQSGKGTRVRIFKDALNKGYIDVIDRFETKEADGMLVEVPIPAANLYEMSKKALFTEFPFFMGYDPDLIDVSPDGGHAQQSVHNPKVFTRLEMGGNTLGWLGKTSSPSVMYALIGKVAYPIDLKRFAALVKENTKDKEFPSVVSSLSSFRRVKVIEVPIGSVDLPSSREEITMSERSIKTLSALISNYALMMNQHIQQDLNTKRTRSQVVSAVAELEESGFKGLSQITWKGESLRLADLLRDTKAIIGNMKITDYGYETGVSVLQAKNLKNFGALRDLNKKGTGQKGMVVIKVKDAAEILKVKKFLKITVLKEHFGIAQNHRSSNNFHAQIVVLTEDDVLSNWLPSGGTEIAASALETIVEKHELAQKIAEEKKQKEAERAQKARERQKKAQETRAETMLSNFVINGGNGENVARNTVAHVFKNKDSQPIYYWSEEEVAQFANVKKKNMKLVEGSLLFPFKPNNLPNSFSVLHGKEDGWRRISYLRTLRSFLRMFFEDGTKMIVLGKERSLEEFKAEYPDVPSGVLAVKGFIETQIGDADSEIMIAYNAINETGGRFANKDGARNLLSFVESLTEEEKGFTNEEILDAAERFSVVLSSPEIVGSLGAKMFMNYIEGFASVTAIQKNSYSVQDDVERLTKKYPLIMCASFDNYTDDVKNDMFEYIKMCDKK